MLGIPLAATIIALLAVAPASAATLRLDGAVAGEALGASVSAAGDFNGDGHEDLVVGAPQASPAGHLHAGAAFVVLGPLAPGERTLGGQGVVPISGSRAGGVVGSSVAAAGDVNGDGLDDVVIGAPGAAPNQEGPRGPAGRAYVVFGSPTPTPVDLAALGARGFAVIGEQRPFPDAFGWSVTGLGDVNRDGRDDVAIAAPGNEGFEDTASPGRAYVVFGRRSSSTVRTSALGAHGIRLTGGSSGGMRSVAPAGDVDHDGRADVLIGDTGAQHGFGGAFILRGRGPARRAVRDTIAIRGAQKYGDAGYAVAGGADLDGDGLPDLVITAPQGRRSGTRAAGSAWVVSGTAARRSIDLSRPRAGVRELRGRPGDYAGFAVAIAGRADADRNRDVALLAGGSVAVIRGRRASGLQRLANLTSGVGWWLDGTIEDGSFYTTPGAGGFTTVGPGGDFDGDGRSEVVAGARFADHGGADSGSAYVFFAGT